MTIVFFIHRYHVSAGMTPWKGGGFGMYSEFHPGVSQVFIKINGIKYSSDLFPSLNNKIVRRLKSKCAYYPKESNLRDLDFAIKSFLKDSTVESYDICLVNFDLHSRTLSWKTIKTFDSFDD